MNPLTYGVDKGKRKAPRRGVVAIRVAAEERDKDCVTDQQHAFDAAHRSRLSFKNMMRNLDVTLHVSRCPRVYCAFYKSFARHTGKDKRRTSVPTSGPGEPLISGLQ